MISWNTPGFGFRVRHDLLKFSGFRVWDLCMTSWTVSDSECWGLRFSSVGAGGGPCFEVMNGRTTRRV